MNFSRIRGASGRRLSVLALGLALTTHAVDGACQANEERVGARAAAAEGARAFSEKRWDDAIDFFKRAESLVHAPPHLLYMARAQAQVGQLVEARENFLTVMHEELKPDAPQVFRNAKESAAEELKNVEARLPYVTVTLKGATPDVTLSQDGVRIPNALIGIPRPVNPGSHKFEASGKGLGGVAMVQLKEAERQKVVIELTAAGASQVGPVPAAPAPEPTPAAPQATPEPTPAGPAPAEPAGGDTGSSGGGGKGLFIGSMVGFGVGAAGLAMGTVFALGSKSASDDGNKLFKDSNCSQTGCPDQRSRIDDLDSQAKSKKTLAIVGFVVGGVGVATGVTLLVLSGSKHEGSARYEPGVRLAAGPGSLYLNGRF
ncbi:MAG TPA: hypothetical protein VHE30_15560 [Polyangiaceae bacterium]|nr:hypothetical protein [Polyangiaceae bacterium]